MAQMDRRSETEQNEERARESRPESPESPESGMRRMDRRREDERERRRRMERDQGAWPYAGPLSASGYRAGQMGYPGYMGYPWSRFSHGMDPSYEDWQGPGFGTHTPGGWEPRVETFHRGDDMICRVELPGWDKDEVSVFVEEQELVVEGRREENGGEDDEHRHHREDRESGTPGGTYYAHERFSTRVSLPDGVDPDHLKAKFKNGVLEVRIPMPERRTERRSVKIDT